MDIGLRSRRVCLWTALLFAVSGATASARVAPVSASDVAALSSDVQSDFATAQQKLTATDAALGDMSYSDVTKASGAWSTTGPDNWTSGFLPGELWLMYQVTGDPSWETQAQQRQAGLAPEQYDTSTHDIGFMLNTSFGNGWRLTGDPDYEQVLLNGAASLATRYSPVVRAIRSWNNSASAPPSNFVVILDNMMNLSLLWEGAAQSGGNSAWYNMAVNHSDRTMQQFIRSNGSSFHIVTFNGDTGAVVSKTGGVSATSTEARPHSWGIYGFAQAYDATHNPAFLHSANRLAGYYHQKAPADGVPYWDFNAPGIPNASRDSSAAAIAASALIDLSEDQPGTTVGARDLSDARRILLSLSSPAYLSSDPANESILLHGLGVSTASQSDVGTSYGDYYFLEALVRYQAFEAAQAPGS